MIFIDTSIFIDVLRSGGPESSVELFEMIEDEFSAVTSAITVAELSVGAYRSQRDDAIEKTFDLISLVDVIELDKEIAQEGGRIYSELMDKGKEIELNDCLIAATSLSLDIQEIITRDIKHFKRIDGVKARMPKDKI